MAGDIVNDKPVAIAQPPLAHPHEPSLRSLASTDTYRPTTAASWPPPVMASPRSPSFASSSLFSQPKCIKYGSGRHADVELIPQPSDDPDDPLNWPRWRKDLNLASLLATVGLVGAMKTAFVTTGGVMASRYGVEYTTVAALTSVPILLSVLAGLGSSVAAKLWGKRPLYLASAVPLLVGSVWAAAAAADSYAACMAARVLQGLGWGAFDVLVLGSIQDTYFEHERDLPVSLYNIFTIATTWGSPLVGGLASSSGGSFAAQFRVVSALHIVSLPLLVLGAPETAFDRTMAGGLVPPPLFSVGKTVSDVGGGRASPWLSSSSSSSSSSSTGTSCTSSVCSTVVQPIGQVDHLRRAHPLAVLEFFFPALLFSLLSMQR
ncbi:hypothetical protein CDD83_10340 [Cordyceps sp. RAO-2017]|nr:hypothetical protein CDD83_10340 [Cordyceps sp. RAO-2017]